jgi:hypothetical protein
LLVGLFLCGCEGESEAISAAPQKVYALNYSTVSPSLCQIDGFWLKTISPQQTAASGNLTLVFQVAPIDGEESLLRWYNALPATLHVEGATRASQYQWQLVAIERDENGVYALLSMK